MLNVYAAREKFYALDGDFNDAILKAILAAKNVKFAAGYAAAAKEAEKNSAIDINREVENLARKAAKDQSSGIIMNSPKINVKKMPDETGHEAYNHYACEIAIIDAQQLIELYALMDVMAEKLLNISLPLQIFDDEAIVRG